MRSPVLRFIKRPFAVVTQSAMRPPAKQGASAKFEQVFRWENRASSDDGNDNANAVPTTLYAPDIEQQGSRITLTLNVQIKRLDGKRMLLSPDGHDLVMPTKPEPKQHIVQAIGQAYHWYERLRRDNLSISALAKELNMSDGRIHKLLPLTWLAPDILKRALVGELPPSFTLNDLLAAAEHLDWHAQRRYLSLPQLDQLG